MNEEKIYCSIDRRCAKVLIQVEDDALRLKIYDAIIKSYLYKEKPTDKDVVNSVFSVIAMAQSEYAQHFKLKCEKNAANGRKGGLKKAENSKNNIANANNRYQSQANASERKRNVAKCSELSLKESTKVDDNADEKLGVFIGEDGKKHFRQFGGVEDIPDDFPDWPGEGYYADVPGGEWKRV